ncbi:hypothetical protein HPB51_011480 [Rhipicephalus microplus]|uniref:GB1/RHD3-type G domain-containing protein n=1 Tax=Rhipicephalus microplus TaxID=6941 RepID=A0A9J6E9D3_RHIMP|nr:hypothetical protein HPB51_011480 [Rhipicephalus microplus]
MGGEPVQIIRVKVDHSIEFNEPELKRILLADHVKDRPVVVISIAGEYRQGKSFLLSFFLRYLQNNCRSNWMDDEETPLIGFQWRPGSIRETTGILIWSEAFLMTNSKGEEVAVLLMDTQGIFDCESTMKESTMIFSLSMMTSSVQIYNVMSNIKEDDLQHLQFFAEYGMLAHKENERHPFQKLLFLVRDWNWPYEWEFGSRGGRALIASRLEINDGQDTELKTLRQSIKSSFSDIDCFLMPHPGDKVAREKSFNGRLVDINEEFREKLQELVPSILAPDNLLVKEINGRTLSCQELMTLFKRPRRNLEELRQFHSALLEEALKIFKDYPRMGSESRSTTSMDALIKARSFVFFIYYPESAQDHHIAATGWPRSSSRCNHHGKSTSKTRLACVTRSCAPTTRKRKLVDSVPLGYLDSATIVIRLVPTSLMTMVAESK